MVVVNEEALERAKAELRQELGSLLHLDEETGEYHTKACIICDRLLRWNEKQFISRKRLVALKDLFRGCSDIPLHLRSDYQYVKKGHTAEMEQMLLSPRGVFVANIDPSSSYSKPGFCCCDECHKIIGNEQKRQRDVKIPEFAIANGLTIGKTPNELSDLNEVELALVSKARIDKHIFTFYGGCHQSIRGWHSMFEADLENVAGALQQLDQFGVNNTIACSLQGPFTTKQRKIVKEKFQVRPALVLTAMGWLKQNNRLYKDLVIPDLRDLPAPFVLDESDHCHSEDTAIETRYQYTVVFPETEDIRDTNGGFYTMEEFQQHIVDGMSLETTLVSRPTRNRLRDYEGDTLLRAFPLQFPYGYGAFQDTAPERDSASQKNKVKTRYLEYLLRLSLPQMHHGSIILILHNMYESHRAATMAYLKCINKDYNGGESFAEQFSDITVQQLQSAIARRRTGLRVLDNNMHRFLNSLDGVCKSMGHTNDAAKTARMNLFGMNVYFGTPAVFFTVTPDDSNSFRITVNAKGAAPLPPELSDWDDVIESDYGLTINVREKFPGLCDEDFENILGLVIEHVLGWDTSKGEAKEEGGAFGKLDAWTAAIEEQGRKTLHVHFLLYVNGWGQLLKKLRSSNEDERLTGGEELKQYIDTIISTELFGGLSLRDRIKAYYHTCSKRKHPAPESCTDQDLRNLRYKNGVTSFGDKNIAKCPNCSKCFTSEDLVNNTLSSFFGNSESQELKLRLAVKRFSAGFGNGLFEHERTRAMFTISAFQNLHRSAHAASCFKKGCHCRFCYPCRPCATTTILFDTERLMKWTSWNGESRTVPPFFVEPKRHRFDVFTNAHHRMSSEVLGCNTNVQAGIDGGHMMYTTLYQSKGTQKEDSMPYLRVAQTLVKRLEAQRDSAAGVAQVGTPGAAGEVTPFAEGYRRLLSAALAHTEAHVVSAPLARFIVLNQGRFLLSHNTVYIPLSSFLGKGNYSRIQAHGNATFVDNKANDYIYRPLELENVCLYDFFRLYKTQRTGQREKPEIMQYSSELHPAFHYQGVMELDTPTVPLVSYLDFPDSLKFGGMSMFGEAIPLERQGVMERYAKSALLLLVPFRQPDDFTEDGTITYLEAFRRLYTDGYVNDCMVQILQNIQDCRNLLKAGRQKDPLERVTVPLVEEGGELKEAKGPTREDVDDFLADLMTRAIHLFEEGDDNADEEVLTNEGVVLLRFTSEKIRHKGADKDNINKVGSLNIDLVSDVFTLANEHVASSGTEDNTSLQPFPQRRVTKEDLTTLSVTAVARNVNIILERSLADIAPNGTPESIDAYADIAFRHPGTGVLDPDQRRAFQIIISNFLLTFHRDAETEARVQQQYGTYTSESDDRRQRRRYSDLRKELVRLSGISQHDNDHQLLMFLTGPGGSGKSQVINTVLAYAKGFCAELAYPFDKQTIVVTAMTGVAATLINGETIHKAVHLNKSKISSTEMEEWKHSRLLIVDEISFASVQDITNLDRTLRALRQRLYSKYGAMSIVFTGDFCQLEPIKQEPLYYNLSFAPWHHWLNCFWELRGQHRFSDGLFGGIMGRMRDGYLQSHDYDLLDTRVVDKDLPPNIAYATGTNADRAAINASVFMRHLHRTHSEDPTVPPPKHTLVVFSEDMEWRTKKTSSSPKLFNLKAKLTLWNECSDADVRAGRDKRRCVDPFLKLHNNVPLMLTDNVDVSNKKANGTQCRLHKVVMKPHVTEENFTTILVDGRYVRSIGVNCIEYLECRLEDNETIITVEPAKENVRISRMPLELVPGQVIRTQVHAQLTTLPVLINHATTGHKLQGQTKESLFINAWSYGVKNWVYVVLSRVTTLAGLFLRTPLDREKNFANDDRMTRMINFFRQNKQPMDPTDYDD